MAESDTPAGKGGEQGAKRKRGAKSPASADARATPRKGASRAKKAAKPAAEVSDQKSAPRRKTTAASASVAPAGPIASAEPAAPAPEVEPVPVEPAEMPAPAAEAVPEPAEPAIPPPPPTLVGRWLDDDGDRVEIAVQDDGAVRIVAFEGRTGAPFAVAGVEWDGARLRWTLTNGPLVLRYETRVIAAGAIEVDWANAIQDRAHLPARFRHLPLAGRQCLVPVPEAD